MAHAAATDSRGRWVRGERAGIMMSRSGVDVWWVWWVGSPMSFTAVTVEALPTLRWRS